MSKPAVLPDAAGYVVPAVLREAILISPHQDVANELRDMLDSWNQLGEYPFSVQVWSPENRVREMFALEPAVYQAVYGHPPAAEEVQASAEAAEVFRQLLTPRLRLDAVWRRYVTEPESLCFVDEDARHFADLYGSHLPLRAADERGTPLPGRLLLEEVTAWAHHDGAAPMLLLADFGEGKSVFTYCLTRLLCEELRATPDSGILPLRIPLRDFTKAGSARGLLERRLREIGGSYADWRRVGGQVRKLAILDGFDEMSVDLSPGAITANLRAMEECLTELSGSKVLVTSRQRVLEGTRDWKRTLDRLRQPEIRRIAPGSRRQRVQYLKRFATDEAKARVLANLRNLYDPIGLAAKPLFLEMIKDTLDKLREDTFSEKILYDTYIDKSLKNKVELLADDDRQLYDAELAANLKDILEEIAVGLQETNGAYLYLRDYQTQDRAKIAELLWKIRDEATPAPREPYTLAAQDDAANRVSIRSLLKGVPAPKPDQWPVDFFHRSMREYFVARAIVHALTADTDQLRRILTCAPLVPEIIHFAGTILREQPDAQALAALERLACSATTDQDQDYLGGNALTLLHAAGADLSHRDWSGLRLDHAKLRGADLRATWFVGSSLRFANLDNANLEDADLTGSDLEGVRLEETSQVLAVTALGDRIIAAYEDQSLREWRGQPGSAWESQVVATLGHKTNHLQVTPLGCIIASGDGVLSVLDIATGETPGVPCQFRTSSRSRAAVLGARTALFAEETDRAGLLVTWLDVLSAQPLDQLQIDGTVTACAQVDGELYAVATTSAIHVVWPDDGTGERSSMTLLEQGVTCLALWSDGNGVLLAAGNAEGLVVLSRVNPEGITTRIWQRDLHTGPVTAILLDLEDQVITGGTDRSVCITPTAERPHAPVQRLHLTLRCRNVRFEGVRTQYEQDKLRKYSAT